MLDKFTTIEYELDKKITFKQKKMRAKVIIQNKRKRVKKIN